MYVCVCVTNWIHSEQRMIDSRDESNVVWTFSYYHPLSNLIIGLCGYYHTVCLLKYCICMTIAVMIGGVLPELKMVLSMVSMVMFTMFANTTTEVLSWFEYVKGFYVVVNVLLYNYYHVDPSVASNKIRLILSVCLMVNVSEVSLYQVLKPQLEESADVNSSGWLIQCGLCLCVRGLLLMFE